MSNATRAGSVNLYRTSFPARRRAAAILLALTVALPGVAAPAATLQRATLTVSDLDASLAFYRDLLGFTVSGRASYDTPALRRMFRVPDGVIPELVLLDGVDQSRVLALVAADGLTVDAGANTRHAPALVVTTDDIGRLDERLRAAGTPVIVPPTPLRAFDGSLLGVEAMYLDPDGVRVVVFDYGATGADS
jgi:catechol 2,3-dioxygenase-like lactoylglutathione lyase family enzyme